MADPIIPTTLTPQTAVGPYPSGTITTGDLQPTWAAGDATNGNRWLARKGDLLFAYNSSADTAATITISSQPNRNKRTGDITDYSVAAGKIACFNFSETDGWIDSSGYIAVTPSATALKLVVLRLTRG